MYGCHRLGLAAPARPVNNAKIRSVAWSEAKIPGSTASLPRTAPAERGLAGMGGDFGIYAFIYKYIHVYAQLYYYYNYIIPAWGCCRVSHTALSPHGRFGRGHFQMSEGVLYKHPKISAAFAVEKMGGFVQTRPVPGGKHGQNPPPPLLTSLAVLQSTSALTLCHLYNSRFPGRQRVSGTVIRSRNIWEQLPPLLSTYRSSSTGTFESPVAFQLGILLKELLRHVLRSVSGCPVTWSISF